MRHISISFICIVLFISAKAQFTVGPKAGLNIAKIAFSSPSFSSSFTPGYYVGGFINYKLNENWSGQFEALYSAEGTKEKGVQNNGSGHINPGYLELPLLVQYHTKWGWFAEAGPQLAFLLKMKETYGGATNDIKKYYHSTDFRVPFGVGYQFPASSPLKGLGINARYAFNFSAINKDVVGGNTLKNQVISIGAFYKIPVGKRK